MIAKKQNQNQLGFYNSFEEQLDYKHPIYILAHQIHWQQFEDAFAKHYSQTMGAPAKPIRLMVITFPSISLFLPDPIQYN